MRIPMLAAAAAVWAATPQIVVCLAVEGESTPAGRLSIAYELPHWLMIRAPHVPGDVIRVNYLEAYCRANSTDADWGKHTVIAHRTELQPDSDQGAAIRLRDTLADGLIVEHLITTGADEVDFRLTAHNPTAKRSEAHWAQPCVRLGPFTGYAERGGNLEDYLPKCFIFLGGDAIRMPRIRPWAKEARYTPGQVWRPTDVPPTDVNPRPVSRLTPDNGLIGAYSADEEWIFATAWEPYQELFQGVIRCLHSDFRLGGLQAGETKKIRGKIYIVPADMSALLRRYQTDFPEHSSPPSKEDDT